MATTQYVCKNKRILKKRRSPTPGFKGSPQKKGMCLLVYIVTPKKPNSGKRKVTRVSLSNLKQVVCSIPGAGHNLARYSNVLVRGGNIKDVPGLKYRVIRGCFDFVALKTKRAGRSKYGCSLPPKSRGRRKVIRRP